jgi:hypothetical protein
MSYYAGCRLKIKLPSNRAADKHAIRQALVERIPGVDVEFISTLMLMPLAWTKLSFPTAMRCLPRGMLTFVRSLGLSSSADSTGGGGSRFVLTAPLTEACRLIRGQQTFMVPIVLSTFKVSRLPIRARTSST